MTRMASCATALDAIEERSKAAVAPFNFLVTLRRFVMSFSLGRYEPSLPPARRFPICSSGPPCPDHAVCRFGLAQETPLVTGPPSTGVQVVGHMIALHELISTCSSALLSDEPKSGCLAELRAGPQRDRRKISVVGCIRPMLRLHRESGMPPVGQAMMPSGGGRVQA